MVSGVKVNGKIFKGTYSYIVRRVSLVLFRKMKLNTLFVRRLINLML
jgi:hypothetical protein